MERRWRLARLAAAICLSVSGVRGATIHWTGSGASQDPVWAANGIRIHPVIGELLDRAITGAGPTTLEREARERKPVAAAPGFSFTGLTQNPDGTMTPDVLGVALDDEIDVCAGLLSDELPAFEVRWGADGPAAVLVQRSTTSGVLDQPGAASWLSGQNPATLELSWADRVEDIVVPATVLGFALLAITTAGGVLAVRRRR